jgi:FkbM family methyltransferase
MKRFPSTLFITVLGLFFTVVYTGFLLSILYLFQNDSSSTFAPNHNQLAVQHRTQATICPIKEPDQLSSDSKSQSQEDSILLRWFNGLCGGTYLEMGALNGVQFSNSHLFHKQLDWKGLLIEPNPINYKELVQNRPNEIALVHAAVCDTEQTVHFVNSENNAVGGIWEFAAPSFKRDWWWGITLDSPQVQKITCMPLRKIIQEHVGDIAYFDFYSLDVEGAELQVLQSIDFDTVGFGIIFLEADEHNERKNSAVRAFLFTKGYIHVKLEARSDWFIHKDFATIYKDVL